MKTKPFRSKLPNTDKYHDNTSCQVGDNIQPWNRVPGTGGLPKCHYCQRLN